jgi:conjugal transfer pilus assembly protein TraK
MISKNLKINLITIAFLTVFLCQTAFANTPAYTVRLGEFKTIPAITEFYRLVPEKFHSTTVICHKGETYTLNCGTFEQDKDIQPLFAQLKDLGLNPQIVKLESGDCPPADTFLKTAALPPLPPLPDPGSIQKEAYADLNDPDVIFSLESDSRIVLPEITTKVFLSNRDVNRIICQNGPIKDVVYSQEKGISVKTENNNAFIKFLISGNPMAGNMTYSETPSEIYVICGEDNTVYTLIALPKDIPAQTIELVSNKKQIKKTLSVFEGLAFEKKVILLIQSAYKDEVAESFTVKNIHQSSDVFRDMDVLLNRQILADGEGLILKEYILSLKPTTDKTTLPLDEKFFLVPEITQHPVGIALEHMTLEIGQLCRLFVVEKHLDEKGWKQ